MVKVHGLDCVSSCDVSKRLNCVNHARRLANGDWTGADSDEEVEQEGENMEKQSGREQQENGKTEEEEMEVERRKPRSYANQVQSRPVCAPRWEYVKIGKKKKKKK